MLEVMKCDICGKLVMMLREGADGLICCGQPMAKLSEKKVDAHAPRIRREGDRISIEVPGVASPMGRDHYIEWIEVFEGPNLHVKGLKPGDAPKAEFMVKGSRVKVRTYCEEHGLCSDHPSKR